MLTLPHSPGFMAFKSASLSGLVGAPMQPGAPSRPAGVCTGNSKVLFKALLARLERLVMSSTLESLDCEQLI